MKLKFKVQPYQTTAVESVVDCFAGQVNISNTAYRIDPGINKHMSGQYQPELLEQTGFRNVDIQLTDAQLIDNIQAVQRPENAGYQRNQTADLVEILIELIKSNPDSGEDVLISGFGKFCVKKKRKRRGWYPAMGGRTTCEGREGVSEFSVNFQPVCQIT